MEYKKRMAEEWINMERGQTGRMNDEWMLLKEDVKGCARVTYGVRRLMKGIGRRSM